LRKSNHLAQLLDRLLEAGDVLEARAQVAAVEDLVLRAAERQAGAQAAAAGAAHEPDPEADQEADRQQPGEQAEQEAREAARLRAAELDVVRRELREQRRLVHTRRPGRGEVDLLRPLLVDAVHALRADRNLHHPVFLHEREELRVGNRLPRRRAR
jgi:hypothetical protein